MASATLLVLCSTSHFPTEGSSLNVGRGFLAESREGKEPGSMKQKKEELENT